MLDTKLLEQLKRHEGERLTAYIDTVGVLTVGVGHNCKTSPVEGVRKAGDKITKKLSDKLFQEDVEKHNALLDKSLPWIKKLNPPRQAVLYNMAFNLGIQGLLGFRNTLLLIRSECYDKAAIAMLKSKWATQVGNRAIELSNQMKTGEWQEGV